MNGNQRPKFLPFFFSRTSISPAIHRIWNSLAGLALYPRLLFLHPELLFLPPVRPSRLCLLFVEWREEWPEAKGSAGGGDGGSASLRICILSSSPPSSPPPLSPSLRPPYFLASITHRRRELVRPPETHQQGSSKNRLMCRCTIV